MRYIFTARLPRTATEEYYGFSGYPPETFVRPEHLEQYKNWTREFEIEVFDGLQNRLVTTLRSREDIEIFEEVLGRNAVWGPPTRARVSFNKPLIDSNLKTAAAVANNKTPFAGVPPVGFAALGWGMQTGVIKYGKFNWRNTGVTASVFGEAMLRHVLDWLCGENHAPDTNVHHLAHLMASPAIVLDAELHGVFNDDRDRVNVKTLEQMKNLLLKDGILNPGIKA